MSQVVFIIASGALASRSAPQFSRRSAMGLAAAVAVSPHAPAYAEETVKVYFGAGCFW